MKIIALLLLMLWMAAPSSAATKRKAAPHHPATAHTAAHRATKGTTAWLGGFVSRDLENGPSMLGGELMVRPGRRLGLRVTVAHGDRTTRTTIDGAYFFCPKTPIQPYLGVGAVIDCISHRDEPTPAQPNPPQEPPVPVDPPSVFLGIQGRNRTAPFAEARYIFGDQDHAVIAIGIRHRI